MTTIQNLLKTSLVFKSDDFITNTICSNFLVETENKNYFICICLLKDKIYQLYNEYNQKLNLNILNNKERIEKLLNNEINADSEYTIPQMTDSLIKTCTIFGKCFISFCKLIPGLNKLTTDELADLVYERLPLLMSIQFSPLMFDNESYVVLHDNKILSKNWLIILTSTECFESRYKFCCQLNKLNLTKKELAMLYPLIISTSGN